MRATSTRTCSRRGRFRSSGRCPTWSTATASCANWPSRPATSFPGMTRWCSSAIRRLRPSCKASSSGSTDHRPLGEVAMASRISLLVAIVAVAVVCVAFGVPFEFVLFGVTLAGVAVFHQHTLPVAVAGLTAIVLYKLFVTGFKTGAGLGGLGIHLLHEWVILTNLLGLLLGFALLSRHFEESRAPEVLPRFLPDDWKGAFMLLVMIFVLSSFLDNIAAALIGGTIAATVFRRKVHIGYLAAIVAASNAGGSGSVIGDTTTTMMWIDGV